MQEVAFTLANGIAYVQAAIDAGLSVDTFGPRLSFFFNAHNNLLEEVAKFRAARRLWARIMRDRFGATNDRAMMLRFHAQTGGSTLTAQQPENNIVRVATQVLSAALGGAQSIHANGFDEALALPTERAAKLALRTQQVIAAESGITDTVDPLGGSWYVESLTAEIERRATALIDEIDRRGGAVQCIDLMSRADPRLPPTATSRRWPRASGRSSASTRTPRRTTSTPRSCESTPRSSGPRSPASPSCAPGATPAPSRGASTPFAPPPAASDNLLYPMRDALRARATVGEVCNVLRDEWGEHDRLRSRQ